ncbi:MAG: CHRD domain-containing protein [Planctomycetota bacterium]
MICRVASTVFAGVLSLCFFGSADADLHYFELTGAGGDGLLQGNIDPPTGEPGSGGIGSTGIFFDDQTSTLHVDVVWGSGFGFGDLSQDVDRLHLHGPTADSAPLNFGQTAPLLVNLSSSLSFDATATGGGVNDDFFLSANDANDLLAGRLYINVHLTPTDTGMIRGYLVQIPEPGTVVPILIGATSFVLRRRRSL